MNPDLRRKEPRRRGNATAVRSNIANGAIIPWQNRFAGVSFKLPKRQQLEDAYPMTRTPMHSVTATRIAARAFAWDVLPGGRLSGFGLGIPLSLLR